MTYLITFTEGMITFISPCLLPMLPIYFSYLGGSDRTDRRALLKNAVGFVLGFTMMFILLGAFSGQLGHLLRAYQRQVNLFCGLIVLLCGLSYLGVFAFPQFKKITLKINENRFSWLKSVLFGLIFSISWTPCVGTFLASALMLAASQSSMIEGMLLLACYSLGLAVPMLLSALLLEQLREAFDWIKQHYHLINRICGILLVIVGILMAAGILSDWLYRL